MFELPKLPYAYAALAPHISEQIMQLHHSKHHQTYVDKLNTALQQAPELQGKPIETLLRTVNTLPEAIRTAVRNHGGGHYNHSLFWTIMSPDGGGQPTGKLAEAITAQYGSFEQFVTAFTTKATGLFGSGWVWLLPDLSIVETSNQDTPIGDYYPGNHAEPLMGLDVWEHAYYLDYTFKRADYIAAWWNVISWPAIEQRFVKSQS